MIQAAVLEQAIAEPRTAKQRDQHQPVDQQKRARQRIEPREQEHDRQKDEPGQRRGARDIEQIRQRSVAPDAAVEPGHEEHGPGNQRKRDAIEHDQLRLQNRQHLVADPQIQGEHERQRGHHEIVQERENSAAGFREKRHAAVRPDGSEERPFYSKDRQNRKCRRQALYPGDEKGQCLTRPWDRERLRKAAAESPCRSPGT